MRRMTLARYKRILFIFAPMLRLFSVLLLIGLLAHACSSPPATNPPQESPGECPQLARLLGHVGQLDAHLAETAEWKTIAQAMDRVLQGLATNLKQEETECSYLNLEHFPDQPRFLFIDELAYRTQQDTLPEGIYYLLRLRGIFSEDPAISEYLSEELARLALQNPACYLAYLTENPDQEVMLLYSTKWNFLDADLLIERFSELAGAASVVRYLKEWKIKQSTGGR